MSDLASATARASEAAVLPSRETATLSEGKKFYHQASLAAVTGTAVAADNRLHPSARKWVNASPRPVLTVELRYHTATVLQVWFGGGVFVCSEFVCFGVVSDARVGVGFQVLDETSRRVSSQSS